MTLMSTMLLTILLLLYYWHQQSNSFLRGISDDLIACFSGNPGCGWSSASKGFSVESIDFLEVTCTLLITTRLGVPSELLDLRKLLLGTAVAASIGRRSPRSDDTVSVDVKLSSLEGSKFKLPPAVTETSFWSKLSTGSARQ